MLTKKTIAETDFKSNSKKTRGCYVTKDIYQDSVFDQVRLLICELQLSCLDAEQAAVCFLQVNKKATYLYIHIQQEKILLLMMTVISLYL